jgi:hypothetical protein
MAAFMKGMYPGMGREEDFRRMQQGAYFDQGMGMDLDVDPEDAMGTSFKRLRSPTDTFFHFPALKMHQFASMFHNR